VWDARQADSEIPDAEIADAVGLRINHVVDGGRLLHARV
jgi:hypothetical protein